MKDTILAQVNTTQFGELFFIIRESEGYIKQNFPVLFASRDQVLLTTSVKVKGLLKKYIEFGVTSSTGKKTRISIPAVEFREEVNSPGFNHFLKEVSFFNAASSAMPDEYFMKSLAFEPFNFQDIDESQNICDLGYDELLQVLKNVEVVEENLTLSQSMSEFKDDFDWALRVIQQGRDVNISAIDPTRRQLIEKIVGRCKLIMVNAQMKFKR